jgi:hypothetical protein
MTCHTEIVLRDGTVVRVARDPVVVIGDLMRYQDLGRGFVAFVDEDGETHHVVPRQVQSVRELAGEGVLVSKPAA